MIPQEKIRSGLPVWHVLPTISQLKIMNFKPQLPIQGTVELDFGQFCGPYIVNNDAKTIKMVQEGNFNYEEYASLVGPIDMYETFEEAQDAYVHAMIKYIREKEKELEQEIQEFKEYQRIHGIKV